ncbi:hypothetical protein, partial [Endozoicomonas sp. ONNA2]|uniref:hypothetical protein n=1 Tax=Endozoicomonas sp. ONNA2 TaxID=2828741 RepID=UPI002147CB85
IIRNAEFKMGKLFLDDSLTSWGFFRNDVVILLTPGKCRRSLPAKAREVIDQLCNWLEKNRY